MIRDAIKYVVELGNRKEVEINGHMYSNNNLDLIRTPKVSTVHVNTLTGLVEYIKSGFDVLEDRKFMLHVESPTEVCLVSTVGGNDNGRDILISASPLLPHINFDRYIKTEDFNVMLQSCFVKNEDRGLLLKFSGNVQENTSRKTQDDGITQVVEMKTGVTNIQNVAVPNPVTLAPYRTFTEIEQVESDFIFRVKEGPQCAIFEADGGAWRNETMKRIKEYLRAELGDEIIILA